MQLVFSEQIDPAIAAALGIELAVARVNAARSGAYVTACNANDAQDLRNDMVWDRLFNYEHAIRALGTHLRLLNGGSLEDTSKMTDDLRAAEGFRSWHDWFCDELFDVCNDLIRETETSKSN